MRRVRAWRSGFAPARRQGSSDVPLLLGATLVPVGHLDVVLRRRKAVEAAFAKHGHTVVAPDLIDDILAAVRGLHVEALRTEAARLESRDGDMALERGNSWRGYELDHAVRMVSAADFIEREFG